MELPSYLDLDSLGVWWDDNGYPRFPDDSLVSVPELSARYCVRAFDSAKLCFLDPQHFTPYQRDCLSREGHWFAVVGDFIVDPWACWANLIDYCTVHRESSAARTLYAGHWAYPLAA